MSIRLNNGVANVKGTPAMITADFATAPAASAVAIGTIWIDTVSHNILQSDGGTWNTIGGGGATPNLQNVLDAGNIANDNTIILYNSGTDTTSILASDDGLTQLETASLVNSRLNTTELFIDDRNQSINISPSYTQYEKISSGLIQQLYPNPTFANQKVYISESDGTIQLQDSRYIGLINSTPSTPTVQFNCIHRVVAGASSIVLNPTFWKDRITGIFLFDVTAVTFSVTGGATLRGIALINVTGLYYVTYLSSANTFYLSHTA